MQMKKADTDNYVEAYQDALNKASVGSPVKEDA